MKKTRIEIFKEAISPIDGTCIGAEIGVWRGDFSQKLLEHLPSCHIYLIDPWVSIEDIPQRLHTKPQDQMDKIFEYVKDRFKDNGKNITILRDYSKSASTRFVDSFFDWIYLDGNHSFEYVKDDLYRWWEKLKKGGVFIGDDYQEGDYQVNVLDFGVVKAVNEFIKEKENEIKNFRVIQDQFIIEKL